MLNPIYYLYFHYKGLVIYYFINVRSNNLITFHLKTHGKVNDNITIITKMILKIVKGFILLLVFILFSSNVPYHCPPSNIVIGSALNIPTLKLINQIQKSKFATIGNVGPKILDE